MENQQNSPNQAMPQVAAAPVGNPRFPSFSEIWKAAWVAYSAKKWQLVAISLAFFGLSFLFSGLPRFFIKLAEPQKLTMATFPAFVGTAGASGILDLLGVYLGLAGGAAIFYILSKRNSNPKFSEAFIFGLRKGFWIWLASLIISIITGIGFLFFIVPGIIFSYWFVLTALIIVDKDTDTFNAMGLSKKYMEGNIGAVFMRQFVLGLVCLGAGLALGIFFAILLAIPVLQIVAVFVLPLVLFPVLIIIAPFFSAFNFVLYEKIRDAKEAGKSFAKSKDYIWMIIISILQWILIAFLFLVLILGLAAWAQKNIKPDNLLSNLGAAQLISSAQAYKGEHNGSYAGFVCSTNETTKKVCADLLKDSGKEPKVNVSGDGQAICIETANYCIDNNLQSGEGICMPDSKCSASSTKSSDLGSSIKDYFEKLIK